MSTVNQAQRVLGACALLATSAALAACGDDSGGSVTLTLLTPANEQILTLEDDSDPDEPGVQLDVTGRSTGLRDGTPIELYVDGDAHGATGDVAADGTITLEDVTLEPGEHTIYLRTAVGSVQSDEEHSYTLRALVITEPESGDEVSDQNDEVDGIQITVRTQSFAVDLEADVSLRVDGEEVMTASSDIDGTAVFEVTLEEGDHTLQARAGSGDEQVSSEDVAIEVTDGEQPPPPACEGVELLAPSSPDSTIVLGGTACDDEGVVSTRVELTIEAEDGTSAELQLNGVTVGEAEVDGGAVEFTGVEFSEADGNELTLVIDGNECSVTEQDIQVDCAVPSCVIRAPEPIEVGGTLYLSGTQLAGEGFDIEVETDAEAEGSMVALIIDGEEADPLTATAGEVGGDIVALFEGVELSDGPHEVSARCLDANGNIATTPTVDFVVDTTACGVDITAPMEGSVFLPADDTTPGTAGVQVGAIAGVTGDDCVAARSGLCPEGELSGDFSEFDGTPHTALVTLEAGVTSQSYCVEIRDQVGNVGGDQVSFMLREVAPMVLIESPATGTDFNVAGGSGRVADATPTTSVCDAEFTVACEVGTMVELHRDDADGALIASGECMADDEAPTGFDGRAVITAVVNEVAGDESATIVATQTFSGSSENLVGVSAPVTYETDCEPPALVETNTPCSLHASQQITDDEAASFVVALGDTTADTESAELLYWIGDDAVEPLGAPTEMETGVVAGGNAITFAPIDFGDLGPLFVAATLEDDFGNVTEYACESEIVDELPSITVVTWPADGAEYGPGDSECEPTQGGFGIDIEVTIDRADDREARLLVNGEVVEDELVIDGTTIEYCVPVPDDSENTPAGPTTIRLEVGEIAGNGLDFVERDVSVHTILITDPVEDELIVSAVDCDDGTGFGVNVAVEFDAVHDGEDYTIVADGAEVTGTVDDADLTIEACVPVTVGGERTITASIDGTDVEHSVTVNVVDDTPMIASIDAPSDGEDFGVGDQTCAAAGINTYGVNFVATLDQADNRTADIVVNGDLVLEDVAISSGGVIDVCLDIPDDLDNEGPTTITLNVAAELGTGTATDSVEISVDTLEIVDPVADELLTAVDDCIVGAGFGYLVELAVDPAHLGRSYSITGGTEAATGVIMDDVITACVALTPADPVTITASITGTDITESVEVEIEDAPPTIAAVTPANNTTFGPGGQTCSAGATNYGVQVQATIDQSDNRVALVSINGGAAVTATIVGTTATACVAVPDNLDHAGPSTITVRLEEETGTRFDTETITVGVDMLNITSPAAGQQLGPAADCDPTAGFGVQVSIAVDAALAGRSYTVDGGLADLTGTVAGTTITGCLAADNTTTAIVASIASSAITETRAITVFTGGAPSMALPFTRTCPDTASMGYRDAPATLTWGDLTALEDFEDQFATLQLRCAHTPIASAATPAAWWTAATPITLTGVTPDSTGTSLPFRVGETRYCVLRAANAAMELTPIPTTATDVTCGFRSQLLFAGTMGTNTAIGLWSAAVGDVNGDSLDDALVGGSSRAQLFFGSSTGFTGTPSVSFTSAANLGNRVAGLGDINGDGLNDFAIAHSNFGGGAGQVFIFFGRAASSPWPAAVDLSVACGADLCIKHAATDARLANSMAGIGDFDGDGLKDVAFGTFTPDVDASRLFIVLGGQYETRSCTMASDCRASEVCGDDDTCEKGAGQSFWNLDFSLPTGNWTNPPSGPAQARLDGFVLESNASNPTLGRGLAAVGAFDSTAGEDIIVSSAGNATQSAKLYFLSGRDDPAGPGIATLTFADLGFRSAMGVPSGTPFETTTRDTGNIMFGAGNIYDVAGAANPGAVDILVKRTTEHHFYIYPGDNNFAPANRIRMAGPNGSDLGISLTRGVHGALPSNPAYPTPGMIGDLDGDGRPEFAAGTIGAVGVPGQVYLWYADSLDTGISSGVQQATTGSLIEPPAAAGTRQRIVQFAGDMTGDGNPDLVVGNWQANSLLGEVYLLY